jgi:hypothetical protein
MPSHKCPKCGKRIDGTFSLIAHENNCGETPALLDAIADTVLAYRPVARSKPAVQRKRRRTILEKKSRKAKR